MAIDQFALLEQQNGLPPGLLKAVMNVESGGNPNAVSPKGAQGAFQFMPATAKAYGINPFDPQESAIGAARMYGDLSKQFQGDVPSMLAAYNWGSGNLTQQGLANAPQETRDYIQKVSAQLSQGQTPKDAVPPPEGFVEISANQPSGPPEGFVELTSDAALYNDQNADKAATSPLKAFGLGAADMTSFGLDDELRGFGRAVGTKIRGDQRDFSELIKLGMNELKSEHGQARKDQVVPYVGGQIAGAIIPSLLTPGEALANWASVGGLGTRAAKRGALGAASAGAYGLGSNEGDLADRAKASIDDALVGAGVGVALPAIGKALGYANKKLGKTVLPTSEQIRARASQSFKLADEKGGILKPEIADNFYDKVLEIIPQTEAGKVFKGKTAVTSILDDIPSLKGKPLTLQGAKEVDEALGDLAYSTADNFGKLNSEGKKFLDMQRALRNTIEKADEGMIQGGKEGFNALKEARADWSTSLKVRDLERILENADGREQPVTIIKNGFRSLLKDAKERGYSDKEIKALRKASKTGLTTDLFKLMGSGLIPIGSAITGTVASGPIGGAAAGAAGYALQQGSKAIGVARQTSRAKKAIEAVAEKTGMVERSPLVNLPSPGLSKLLKAPAQPKTIVSTPAQKLLPAPSREFVAGSSGVRQASAEEVFQSNLLRKRASELGLTPDVRKAIAQNETRKKFGGLWDKIDDTEKRKITDQVENAWNSNKISLNEIIENSLDRYRKLSSETSNQVKPGNMYDYFEESLKNSPLIKFSKKFKE